MHLISIIPIVGLLTIKVFSALAPSGIKGGGEIPAQAKQETLSERGIKRPGQKVVVITGARFTYPLIQRWIDDYNQVNPNVQIIIEARGSSDPADYDVLAEVYEHDEETKRSREYVIVGRYAILPVANSRSAFAKGYEDRGLTRELIQQIFFHDLYKEADDEKQIRETYTVYTRLQRAGVPIVFTRYFGFELKDVKGKAIAGADEHLLKALLRDSTGVSYLPLSLIYDKASKNPHPGLSVLPVDLNGNGRVSDDEKFYGDLSAVIKKLEGEGIKKVNNIPIEYLHLSVDKRGSSPEAIDFLRWVIHHGIDDLHQFGYLEPEPVRLEKEKEAFASKTSGR